MTPTSSRTEVFVSSQPKGLWLAAKGPQGWQPRGHRAGSQGVIGLPAKGPEGHKYVGRLGDGWGHSYRRHETCNFHEIGDAANMCEVLMLKINNIENRSKGRLF